MKGMSPLRFEFENTKPTITDAQLLADIKEVAQQLGTQHMPQRLYQVHGHFSTTAIKSRFGSWNRAIAAAGLSVRSRVHLGAEDLFDNLIRVWTALGRQPRKREMAKPLSQFTHHPYLRVFGGWLKAMYAFTEHINSAGVATAVPFGGQFGGPRESREPSLRLRFIVMRRDNFRCRYCGCSPATQTGIVLHVDHIKPWTEGGPTVLDNLQTPV